MTSTKTSDGNEKSSEEQLLLPKIPRLAWLHIYRSTKPGRPLSVWESRTDPYVLEQIRLLCDGVISHRMANTLVYGGESILRNCKGRSCLSNTFFC